MSDRLVLSIDHDRRHRRAAEECEAAVFGQWYGETPQELRDTYEPWDDTCVFLVLTDDEGTVHASARLLPPNPVGLMTLRDVAKAPWGVDVDRSVAAAGLDLTTTWDIATLATRPRWQGGPNLAAALLHGLVRTTVANGVTSLVAILDDRVRRLLASTGIGTHTLPGTATQRYYGSPASTPVHVPIGRVLDTQRRRMPELHRLITLGIGLDGVHVAPREEFVLRSGTADLRGLSASRRVLALD